MSTPTKYAIAFFLSLSTLGLLSAQIMSNKQDFRPKFEVFELPGASAENNVQCIVQDDLGFLWFGTSNGLIRYDGQNFITYRHSLVDSNSMTSSYVEAIFIDSKGLFWISHYTLRGEIGGMTLFDPVTETFTRFYHQPDNPNSISENRISGVIEDRQGYIWIATFAGLDRFDRKTGAFKHFRHAANDPSSLSYDLVRALYLDKQGTLWVGCGFPWDEDDPEDNLGGLVLKVRAGQEVFRFYSNTAFQKEKEYIGSMIEGPDENIWLGSIGGFTPITRFDRKTDRVQYFRSNPSSGNFPTKDVFCLLAGNDGFILAGTDGSGLHRIDPKSGDIRHYRHEAADAKTIGGNYVVGLLEGQDGHIWLAGGEPIDSTRISRFVDRLNPVTGQIQHFSPKREIGPQGFMLVELGNDIWYTAFPKGLQKLNKTTGQITEYNYDGKEGCTQIISLVKGNQIEFQLEPYDQNWRNDLREGQASYFNVPPGKYLFRVRGANSKGVWAEEVVELQVVVRPPWWATWWADMCTSICAWRRRIHP